MRPKFKHELKEHSPGPGKYESICTITPDGNYALSKNRNLMKVCLNT
jgi:hypothetical protein